MGRLIATALCSLDLRTADDGGTFGWATPTPEVHAFVNGLERDTGLYLYGRRMWETMRVWQTIPDGPTPVGEYGRMWRAADKVVYSASALEVTEPRTRVEHRFDPEAVGDLVEAAPTDVSIGGAALAASAFRAGRIDELRLLIAPVIVGSGPRAVPDGVAAELDLVDERRFGGGWVHLRYTLRRR